MSQKTYTISFNKDLADVVEKEMKRGKFDNTSEFFRHVFRHYSQNHEPFIIERLTANDPDYARSQKISKKTKYTPLDQFIGSLSR
jgi:Arc/MetJ-type ribon-helix-helix transcriptional regulator